MTVTSDGEVPGQLSITDIDGHHRSERGIGMSIERLQSHYGFTRMPFGRDWPRRCCTATPDTPKPSPASPGAWTNTPSG